MTNLPSVLRSGPYSSTLETVRLESVQAWRFIPHPLDEGDSGEREQPPTPLGARNQAIILAQATSPGSPHPLRPQTYHTLLAS